MATATLNERRSLVSKRRLDATLELIGGYVVLLAINVVYFPDDMGWLQTVLHPYFALVMLLAARYGTLDGVVSGGLGALIYTWFAFESDPERFATPDFLADLELMQTPYLLLLVGTLLGEVRQVAQDEINQLWANYKRVRGDLQTLSGETRSVRQYNQDLQERIASSTQTTGAFYDAAAAVQTLREDEALPAILEIVERFVGATKSAVYVRAPGGWELRVQRGWASTTEFPRTIDAGNPLLRRVANGDLVTMKDVSLDLEETAIVMAAPLYHGDSVERQVYGAIAVQEIPLTAVNLATVRNLEGISRWASRVLVSAETFGRVKERDPSDAMTGAYRYPYMLKRIEEEVGRWRRYQTPSSLLLMQIVNFDRVPRIKRASFLRRLGRLVGKSVRAVDLVSRWRSGDTFGILLPSTDVQGARVLAARLADQFERQIAPDIPRSARLALRFGIGSAGVHGEGREELVRAAEKLTLDETET